MLICADGTTAGSLSGGCLEEEVARRAMEVMRTGMPSLMSFDTRLRFGCNGRIEIFVEAVDEDFLAELAANFSGRRSCRAVTVFAGSEALGTRLVGRNAEIPGPCFHSGNRAAQSACLCLAKVLTAFRCAPWAEILGWDSPRNRAASGTPRSRRSPDGSDRKVAQLRAGFRRALSFIETRSALRRFARAASAPRPVAQCRLDEGIAIDAEVFAPAGLDLGAETPEELALALVSEIQAVFAGASGESLRDRKAPIHGWNVVRRPATGPLKNAQRRRRNSGCGRIVPVRPAETTG